jgi:hypothetical protein
MTVASYLVFAVCLAASAAVFDEHFNRVLVEGGSDGRPGSRLENALFVLMAAVPAGFFAIPVALPLGAAAGWWLGRRDGAS